MLDQRKWELPSRQSFWCPTSWIFSQIEWRCSGSKKILLSYGVPENSVPPLFWPKFEGLSFSCSKGRNTHPLLEQTPRNSYSKHPLWTEMDRNLSSWTITPEIWSSKMRDFRNLSKMYWLDGKSQVIRGAWTLDIKARLLWIILPELGKIEARHIIPICILWPPYCKHKQKKACSLFLSSVCKQLNYTSRKRNNLLAFPATKSKVHEPAVQKWMQASAETLLWIYSLQLHTSKARPTQAVNACTHPCNLSEFE